MGILGRLSSLIKSNVNDVIDSMQDPAKEIDQMVRDMEDSARQARTEVAQCLGEEKRLQKRVADLEAQLNNPDLYVTRAAEVPKLVTELEQSKKEVTRLFNRWAELEQLPPFITK